MLIRLISPQSRKQEGGVAKEIHSFLVENLLSDRSRQEAGKGWRIVPRDYSESIQERRGIKT
jgi:hypothetical protein